MYKNIKVILKDNSQPFEFDHAEVFGLTMSGFLSVKVGNQWWNINLESVLSYYCEYEDEEEEPELDFSSTNVTRLQ